MHILSNLYLLLLPQPIIPYLTLKKEHFLIEAELPTCRLSPRKLKKQCWVTYVIKITVSKIRSDFSHFNLGLASEWLNSDYERFRGLQWPLIAAYSILQPSL